LHSQLQKPFSFGSRRATISEDRSTPHKLDGIKISRKAPLESSQRENRLPRSSPTQTA
jgi:hypothetical protein